MAGRRAVVSTMKPACLTPRSVTGVHGASSFVCTSSASAGGFAQMLVQLEVLEDEVEALRSSARRISPVSKRTASFSIWATRAASSVLASARKKVSKPRISV